MGIDPTTILGQVVEIGEGLERNYERDTLWMLAAGLFLQTGDLSQVQRLVERIWHESVRCTGHWVIAEALVKAGQLQAALEHASAMPGGHQKDLLLAEVLAAQMKANDEAGAHHTYAQIQDARLKTVAWAGAWGAKAEHRTIRASLDMVAALENVEERAWAIAGIAAGQATGGDVPGALQTVTRIDDQSAKDFALWGVVGVQARNGDVQGALRTTTGLAPHETAQTKALVEIAVAQVRQGDVTGALNTISLLPDEEDRACVMGRVAIAQAEARNLNDALITAASIENSRYRHLASMAIAVQQAEQGNLDLAIETVLSFEDRVFRSYAMQQIAFVQAQQGDYNGAHRTVERTDHSKEAEHSFAANLALIQAGRGDVAQALALAKRQEKPFQKALVLLAVASGILGERDALRIWEYPSCGQLRYRENIFY